MTKRHEGRTAIISGAASGIGQASAIRLAKEGAEIIIADRDKAEKTLQLIAEFGGKATAFQCDVTSPASVEAFRTAVDAAGARCDILVNNAGIYPMQTFDEMTFEDWRHVLTVNLDSMFLMTKAFIDGMKRRKVSGVQTRSIIEPFALDSVQILERVDDIDGQSINMANRVAGAQQRVAVRL